MPETLSPPQEPEVQKNQENDPQQLTERLSEAVAVVDDIREMNKNLIEGRSSFYDVTGNLRATVGPDLRAYVEDGDPEDLAEAENSLEALEDYLEALDVREILDGEFTESGADSQLRQEADAKAAETKKSAIQIYAHLLADKARQAREASLDGEYQAPPS
jgi:hypothetical protein